MIIKQRYQNPVIGDTVELRLFAFNSNNPTNFDSVEKVDIFFLDPNNKSCDNPLGKCFVQTFPGSDVELVECGEYLLDVLLESPQYQVGKYVDEWTVIVLPNDAPTIIDNQFEIFPQLIYTTPIPVVYDFEFHFQPNKIRVGSKQFLQIEINPNVPSASDLARYFENLAIAADLKITIEQSCGACIPAQRDLRVVVDEAPIDFREKNHGFYQLDTRDLACGIYDVTFRLDFGTNIYLSDKMQLLIFD